MSKAYIWKTPGGEELAVLPRADYEAMLTELEDLADHASIEEMRRARAEGRAVLIPAAVTFAMAEGENPVRALRKWRGLTQEQLAEKAGITASYLSQVERGHAPGNKARRALAAVLGVPETMLIEE